MLNDTVKHYDMEVDFFKTFLDPYMKYTSGLFESEADQLEVATQRMLDTIIDSAKIRPGMSVLEIGPGWGALLKRLQERDLICDYVGISPSHTQNSYIRSFCRHRESLITSTFESADLANQSFDAIVLIGSFCHLEDKGEQLQRMRNLLKPKGSIIIEDTFFVSKNTFDQHADLEATRFVQKSIFGFAEILSLSEQFDQIAQVGLKVASMLEHSDSYKQTIKCWIKNLKGLNVHEHPGARDFIKYMTIAQRGWNHTTQNHLLVLNHMR
jgi:cyclopropane-fatty-acyl-phospholipid synthase